MFKISRTLSSTSAFFSLQHVLSILIVRGTDNNNGNNGLFSKIKNMLLPNEIKITGQCFQQCDPLTNLNLSY